MSLRIAPAPLGNPGFAATKPAWSSPPPAADIFMTAPAWAMAAPSTPQGVAGYFVAPSQADAPPPVGGNDGASGVGSGGGDGGNGGKKGKAPLVEQLVTPKTTFHTGELQAHLSFALAQGLMTTEEVRARLEEHVDAQVLAEVRHAFAPDIVSFSEVVEQAIEEISTSGLSDETRALLKEYNARSPEVPQGDSVQQDRSLCYSDDEAPEVTSLPEWLQEWKQGAGPIMHEYAKRFLRASAPELPHLNDMCWSTSHDYRDPFEDQNNRRYNDYKNRVAMRPHVVSLMEAVDRTGANAFFQAIVGKMREVMKDANEEQKTYREMYNAALVALLQLGGRNALDALSDLLSSFAAPHKEFSWMHDDIRSMVDAFGYSLERAVLSGDVSRQEAERAIESLKEHKEAFRKRALSFGHLGTLTIPGSIQALEGLLALPSSSDRKGDALQRLLIDLKFGLDDDNPRLLRLSRGELAHVLKTTLRAVAALEGIAPHLAQECGRRIDDIVIALMRQYTDELRAILAKDEDLNVVFNAWRHQHIRQHTRDQ